jgi:hypothetical protein
MQLVGVGEDMYVGAGEDISAMSSPVVDRSYDEKAQDELDQEEEELHAAGVAELSVDGEEDLLTSGIDVPVQTFNENVGTSLNQFSDDDLEDEELLTAGIDDDAPAPVDTNNDVSPVDYSFDDDNLLSD